MKKIFLPACGLFILASLYAQTSSLPATKIRSLKGEELAFSSVVGMSDTVTIVSLWATWCVPCITELETMKDQYEDRQKVNPFRIIAVSIDDSRTSSRVKPFVKGKGWTFDIYQDVNNDLKRDLNISNVPHVLLVKNGKIIYQHNGYVAGDEEELFEAIRKAY